MLMSCRVSLLMASSPAVSHCLSPPLAFPCCPVLSRAVSGCLFIIIYTSRYVHLSLARSAPNGLTLLPTTAGRIKFHRVDLHELARGTCLEGRHDYLNATVPPDWHDKRVMGPKEKADMTRILLLRQHGGIWLDTDDVLLRDLR